MIILIKNKGIKTIILVINKVEPNVLSNDFSLANWNVFIIWKHDTVFVTKQLIPYSNESCFIYDLQKVQLQAFNLKFL